MASKEITTLGFLLEPKAVKLVAEEYKTARGKKSGIFSPQSSS